MNLYIPGTVDPNRSLPVLFWIYGGGFQASARRKRKHKNKHITKTKNTPKK
jgi:carboxylesterase type B